MRSVNHTRSFQPLHCILSTLQHAHTSHICIPQLQHYRLGSGRPLAESRSRLVLHLVNRVAMVQPSEHVGEYAEVPHAMHSHAAEQVAAAAVREAHHDPEAPYAEEVLAVEVERGEDGGGGSGGGRHRHVPRQRGHEEPPEDDFLLQRRQHACTPTAPRGAQIMPHNDLKLEHNKGPSCALATAWYNTKADLVGQVSEPVVIQ